MDATRLKILYVGHLPPHRGGSAYSCGGLLAGFAARGHAVRALGPITPEAASDGDAFAESHPTLHVSRFVLPRFVTYETFVADAVFRHDQSREIRRLTSQLFTADRPDVVFVGSDRFANDVSAVAEQQGAPSVLRIAVEIRRILETDDRDGAVSREVLSGYRRARRLVAPARHIAEDLRSLGFPDATVIPNAVDTARFAPGPKDPVLLDALTLAPDDLVVAHMAHLRPVKRSLDIVAAARTALRQDPRLVYLIVGEGSERGAMEGACRAAGIQDRFRFVGWVDQAELPRYLNLADLVAMPSETEGLSRVYLETQACGRVLLASDIPAAREVVVPGYTGLLFRRGDPAALAGAMLHAAGDARLRADIGRHARERVVAQHALPDAVTRYLAVLSDAAAAPAGPPR